MTITELGLSFPQLGARFDGVAPGLDPWDVNTFGAWVVEGPLGGGARWAGIFVLSVWNADAPGDFGLPAFDVHSALSVWDRAHRAAFLAWAADPWWP